MSIEYLEDEFLTKAIASLGTHGPNSRRAERTRARCHRAMGGRSTGKPMAAKAVPPISARALEPAFIGAASAVFLVDVVRRALQLWGF